MGIGKLYMPSVGLLFLTLLSGFLLSSAVAFADDSVVDEVNITIPVSCTMQGTGTGSHNATINNGTYNSEVGVTTLRAFCNDNNGFSIYAVGYTDNTYGKNVLASATIGSTYDINTGTGTTGNSQWAMKLATDGTATYPIELQNSFGAFHTVPNQNTLVAKRTAGTDTDTGNNAVGSTLTATYQVFISTNQPADTYIGQVKYVMVHPWNETPTHPETTQAGKICYYPNGSNVLGSMGCQTITASTTNATLLASNFSRDGYGFAGWSTTYDYSDSDGFYGPQEYIEFTAGTYTGSNPGLSLYAHWIPSAGDLQGWTGCSTLSEGSVTALTDKRDNETYAVAKLADGKCWMIENMRIENTATTGATNIALAQGYETGFTGLANSEDPWSTSFSYTTANSLYSVDGSTENTVPSGTYQSYRFPRYNNVNTPSNVSDRPSTPTSNSDANSTSNAGMYSYGNYYTWAAAMANTTVTSTGDYNTKSICPTGWSLPRGGSKSRETTNDFWKLVVTKLNGGTNPTNYDSETYPYYNGSTVAGPVDKLIRRFPNNFVYSGQVDGGLVGTRGSLGYYWSSTAVGNFNANSFNFVSSYVYPGTFNTVKIYGRSVRCVVSPSA